MPETFIEPCNLQRSEILSISSNVHHFLKHFLKKASLYSIGSSGECAAHLFWAVSQYRVRPASQSSHPVEHGCSKSSQPGFP